MFELLKKELLADHERQIENRKFYIENGFLSTWNEESKVKNDNGLCRYSTETRWNQYKENKISREKAVDYAVKRGVKILEKQLKEKLEKLEKVENAPDLTTISVYVDFVKSRTWGYCPKVETFSNNKASYGYASGCGYDKESAAIAEALNSDFSAVKVLYLLKEKGLEIGLSAESKTACTGVDNRNIVGYGSGYAVLPYFEGGVGASCFWSMFEKAGFEVKANYGKKENTYTIYKKEA